MKSDEIYIEKSGELARLVLNRPDKRNALSLQMWRLIPTLFREIDSDPELKVAIVQSSTDTAFSAGADIEELAAHADSEKLATEFMSTIREAEGAIGNCSKPVLAMINGECIGGGMEIAMACDLRFASSHARFGIPPAKLGVVYSLASTRRLVDLVGPGRARDYLFSGRVFDSDEAHRVGLIERNCAPLELDDQVTAYANLLCRRSQWSIRAAKLVVNAACDGELEENREIRRYRTGAFFGPDLKEGVEAFREKRTPRFLWR